MGRPDLTVTNRWKIPVSNGPYAADFCSGAVAADITLLRFRGMCGRTPFRQLGGLIFSTSSQG